MSNILNKIRNTANSVGSAATNVGNIVPGTAIAGNATGINPKIIGIIVVLIILVVAGYFIYTNYFQGDVDAESYYYENMRMYDNLGPGFGRRDPRDTARAPMQEGFEIPAPVGNRQLDESLPSAVSVLNDPRFHTVTKTLLSTQNRIGENIQVRNPTTDLRGSVPVFTSGPGTLFNQQLSRSNFSDTLG